MQKIIGELVVSNETKNLARIRQTVVEGLKKTKLPPKEHGKVTLAVDEAVSNIIRHAYRQFVAGTRTVEITILSDEEKIEVILKDSGKEFDPSNVEEPDVELHIAEGKKHGLGLFLMRQVMDEVRYVFRAGVENMLTMVKYIDR